MKLNLKTYVNVVSLGLCGRARIAFKEKNTHRELSGRLVAKILHKTRNEATVFDRNLGASRMLEKLECLESV